MKKKILFVCLLTALTASCDRQGPRMDEAAEKCAEALNKGALNAAEELCTMALGEDNGAYLKPEIRSERLYHLGNIKRAQAKYPEALELMSQSLAIEESLSGPDSPATGARLLRMGLIVAAQRQWEEGIGYVERTLSLAAHLEERDQATLVSTLKLYAMHFERTQQPELASRFRAAREALMENRQTGQGAASP
jgi:tetratricopeptide (TPR) repeat protein